MTDVEQQRWLRAWMIWAGVALVGLTAILLIFTGNHERGPEHAANSDENVPTVDRELCRKQLVGTLEALQPERLGISSRAEYLAHDLNNWWGACGAAGTNVSVSTDSLQPLLSPEAYERVTDDRFDERDADHIRDCELYRKQAEAIAAASVQDLDRAVAAFDFAVRQVADLPATSDQPPLPCLYAALFGRAEPRYRAWLFAELLRQLGVDCVIIEPAGGEAGDSADDWLVGAIVADEGVYLFDPTAGIAIPGPPVEGDGAGTRPATLREVRDNGGLLRQLDIPDGPAYPWTADRFQQIAVRVISESSWWSLRMARLQNELPGEFLMTVFDGLTDTPYQSAGLLDRVRTAGAGGLWNPEDVSLWAFPETQTTAFYEAGGERGDAITDQMRVLKAPRLLERQHDGKIVGKDSSRPLRMLRVQQLEGDISEALKGLNGVRSAGGANPEAVNELAAEDAVYWIALGQYELDRPDTAESTLDIYLRNYPTGVWTAAVYTLRAHCQARQGKYKEAAQSLLEKTADGSSLSFGDAYLVRQWQAQAAESGEGNPE
jgi:tetratricopeptide (TPR) repeat protein